jgi:hypothetical protein
VDECKPLLQELILNNNAIERIEVGLVQVDSIKPTVEAPGTKRLKL